MCLWLACVLSDSQGGISPPDCTHQIKGGIHLPKNRHVCHLRCFRVPKTHAEVWQIWYSMCGRPGGAAGRQKDPSPSVQNNTIPLYFSNWFTYWMPAYEQHFLLNTPSALWNAPSYPAWPSAAPSKGHGSPRGPMPALLALWGRLAYPKTPQMAPDPSTWITSEPSAFSSTE